MVVKQSKNKLVWGLFACLLAAALSTAVLASCASRPGPANDKTSGSSSGSLTIPGGNATSQSVASTETTLDPSILSFRLLADWDRDYLTVEKQTEWSDVVVAGEVVQIDSPKWNGPDGKRWKPTMGSQVAVVYTTFYVKSTAIMKGESPSANVPIAFRLVGVTSGAISSQAQDLTPTSNVEGRSLPTVSVGDQIVAFGRLDKGRYGGGVYDPADAYWLTSAENSLWVGENDKLLNQGITKYSAERSFSLDSLSSKVAGYVAAQR